MKRLTELLCILTFALLIGAIMDSCNTGAKTEGDSSKKTTNDAKVETIAPNTLSEMEVEQGFVLMFDGENTEGWRGYLKDHFPAAWVIEDGALKCLGSGRGEAGAENGGDIIYEKKFSNFHLKLEWKISEGGNSGIFYLGREDPKYPAIWRTAPEMQVLDNELHPDAVLGEEGNRKVGSLYDLIPARPQNAKPAGEWNAVEIIVYKGTVVHKMNGVNVLEYHLWTPEWEELVAGSKFPAFNEDWANVAKEGYIGLQDHGDDVWFRSKKIREL